ncbi:Acyltransferase family [Serratia proteamaculans]|nr:Acyltransferase family [Serratia proteamaculans]CAI1628489.1 Acyltransferase family [Serratia proteamaculans]
MGMSTKRAFSDGVNSSSYVTYFSKRFLRIAIPYYISILFWVFLIRNYSIAVKPTEFYDILSHVLFFHNFNEETMFSISGVYWSIAVEMQFYLLLPFVVVCCKSSKRKTTILIISALVSNLTNFMSNYRLLTWSISSYLYLFILGWFLFSFSEITVSKRLIYIVRLISAFSFIVLLFYKGSGFDNNIKVYEIIVASIAAIAMWSCILLHAHNEGKPFLWINILSFIGKCSFSIYLYNYIFWALPREHMTTTFALVSFCIVIAFGVLMHFMIEQPSEILRKSIFRKRVNTLTT